MPTYNLLIYVGVYNNADDIFGDPASISRNLLQTKKSCPVDFEFKNYTIITSQCKGPKYPPNICCAAFKEFACPYVDELNDLTNDCASTIFSYINLHGKYPAGLFSRECHEGKRGLECPPTSSTESANVSSGSRIICNPSPLLALTTTGTTTGFLVLLLWFF
ncbi:GPI-anchored protein LLG1 [Camellia lanceoleosa]|uniref:GPI-anchored protein LLG1 n=1 Tax=Camellia lanceoleosa TaxID=1840588 RepID=A0ACC0H663_9ERIC|nr:GPI-anchored protein LLG1 [Camellia lanceoleosa]